MKALNQLGERTNVRNQPTNCSVGCRDPSSAGNLMADVEILSVNVYPTTDFTLDTYDNTKLVAINTCPVWGITRYTYHKTMGSGNSRAMALEAGAAAHEVFAAHRLYSLQEYSGQFYGMQDIDLLPITHAAGTRIFGSERYAELCNAVNPDEDFRTRCNQFSLTALYNSGFYDDVGDRRRTTTNIEEMCLAYMDRFDWSKQLPVMNINGFVGIEIPVDVTVEILYADGYKGEGFTKVRLIGKADGIHWSDETKTVMRVHENKTASRLGDAWEQSWETNHQPTGYMIALSAMLNQPISQSLMLGSCLPMPKAYAINGLSRVVASRPSWMIEEWFKWFLHTVLLHDQYKDKPTDAPMYTHSCNRYFRPCSFIGLCATPPDERQAVFDQMAVDEWSPLAKEGEVTDE